MCLRRVRIEAQRALVIVLGFRPSPIGLQQARRAKRMLPDSVLSSDDRAVDRGERERHDRVGPDVRVERQQRVDVGDSGVRSGERRVLLRRLLEVVERAAERRLAALVEEEAAAKVEIVRLEIGRSARGSRRRARGATATVFAAAGAGALAAAAVPDSSGEIADTIADEISSCILNTSFDSRSNMSDQTVKPSAVFTRRAVTRSRPRSRCTVPTSTMLTPSALPRSTGLAAWSRGALSLPAATRTPGMRLNAFVSSAVMPAAKYASLVSRLMLTSGITAIDRLVTAGAAAGVAVRSPACADWRTMRRPLRPTRECPRRRAPTARAWAFAG